MSDIRIKKLESMLQKELCILLSSGKIKDPRLDDFVSVTRISVSKDTVYAKVYVSCFEGGEALSSSVMALNHAAGYLQSQLAKKIRLRQTPKLTFFPDPGPEEGFDLNRKIEGLST